jgi:hypothetical protein
MRMTTVRTIFKKTQFLTHHIFIFNCGDRVVAVVRGGNSRLHCINNAFSFSKH